MKKYIVNSGTKEIHNEKKLTKMCNIRPGNHFYAGWIGAMFRIWFCGYNGCRWCMNKYDR